jgi:hypothetical protein
VQQANEPATPALAGTGLDTAYDQWWFVPGFIDNATSPNNLYYDPACGTGGMLSVSETYIRNLNRDARPLLFGQDWNDESWAVCRSDMLIKGENADNIRLGDTFTQDGFNRDAEGKKIKFDYVLANPPFGVEWKQQARFIEQEANTLGYNGRFGAHFSPATPAVVRATYASGSLRTTG